MPVSKFDGGMMEFAKLGIAEGLWKCKDGVLLASCNRLCSLLTGPIAKSKFQSQQSVHCAYYFNLHQLPLYMKSRSPVHLSARSSPHRHLHHLPRRVWQSSLRMFWRFS